MAYFPLIVIFAQRYRKDAGIGTVVSLMLPYVIVLSILLDAVLRRLVPDRDPARPGLARAHLMASTGALRAMSDTTITFVVLGGGGGRSSSGTACRSRSWPSARRSRSGRRACSTSRRRSPGSATRRCIFIASLFVVSAAPGRDRGDRLGRAAPGRRARARAGAADRLTMLLVAALTALISVNGAVAALLPVVVVTGDAARGGSPSQLLLPLAFGAHAGSLLALTGTPVNVIVSRLRATTPASGRLRLLRVRARRRPARRGHDRDRRPLRRAAAAAPQRRGDPAPTSAATPARWSSSTGSREPRRRCSRATSASPRS